MGFSSIGSLIWVGARFLSMKITQNKACYPTCNLHVRPPMESFTTSCHVQASLSQPLRLTRVRESDSQPSCQNQKRCKLLVNDRSQSAPKQLNFCPLPLHSDVGGDSAHPGLSGAMDPHSMVSKAVTSVRSLKSGTTGYD